MLDIKYIKENTDEVKKRLETRGVDLSLIDKAIKVDKKRREYQAELDEIRAEKNKLGKEIASLSPEERDARIAALRAEDVKADTLEKNFKESEEGLTKILSSLPNIPDEDVPVGKDESGNKVIKKVGELPEFNFQYADYMELSEEMDLVDTERAAKVSGTRFGYIKGAAALLEFALIQHTYNILTNPDTIAEIAESIDSSLSKTPFIPVLPPVLIREEPYWKMARLTHEIYEIPKDELYLVGSAEHSMGPMHMDEIFSEEELPRRYLGFSTAFRREAGSYGKDTKGILRVHQFDKIEMEVFTRPEDLRAEFDFIIACQEYLVQSLELPYQLVFICTGDMGDPDIRQYDIETWMPGESKYRETHTADMMGDYQARRLNTRFRRKDGEVELVNMIDATAFAIPRTLIAIIENNQQEDGSIKVPEVLRPYVPGNQEVIKGPWGMGS